MKGIGGKGRLTLARVDTIQSFYGKTIRDFKNDSEVMSKATHAIIKIIQAHPKNPIMKTALKTEILGAHTIVILLLGQIITNQSKIFHTPTVVAEI